MNDNKEESVLLHIINRSPFLERALQSCLTVASKGSPIILIEDAVYAAKTGISIEPSIKDIMKDHPVYALSEDLKARGVDDIVDGVNVVDYEGFVDLVEEHNTCSWI